MCKACVVDVACVCVCGGVVHMNAVPTEVTDGCELCCLGVETEL